MSYFPVFMNLEGKPVLVVGGGKVAARKVRALLKSGANVTVTATRLGQELDALNSAGEIEWHSLAFSDEQMEGFWLAFAATDDNELNQTVFKAGEERAIPVNVVDDAKWCRFISPAIIDRDPVQVAVSTGGTSPMLARAVRNWIEMLLPNGFGKIADAAGRLRRNLGNPLSLDERRKNWGFIFDRARVVAWSSQSVETIQRLMRAEFGRNEKHNRQGMVYLVGAGPGRADLLTLRAVEVLQQADVILHDRLVSEDILDRARRDSERIDVGKRVGDHRGVQARIFKLMVEAARSGKTVVRLKGGDAFVFGRGGEELQHLRANGIDYEVVPGITAALGCAAFAGIPLTHRHYAQQLTLATGHLSGDEHRREDGIEGLPGTNHSLKMGQGETLAIYMGVKQAPRVRQQLLKQGTRDTTPVALVINGTMDTQCVLHGTVATLPAMAAQVGEGATGLFIVCEVAALGRELAWFGDAPVFEVAA